MGFSRVGFIFSLFFSVTVLASNQCAELAEDLKAMQTAQKQLLQSLSRKNGTMASVLDQNAQKLEKKMKTQRALKRSDLNPLKASANSFRGHERREAQIIEQFERASDSLLDQVQVCLVQNSTDKN